jgi:hypothetical protein
LDFVARILKLPNTEAAKTLLLAILTPDESEQVLAYHQRRQLHLQMEKKAIRLEWEALKTIAQLAPCDRRDEIRVLDRLETNFGIQYSIVQGFRKSFSISPTQQDNLALFRFSVKAQTGGILVVGSKFQSDGMLFEQHLGTFQLEPLVIDLPKPQSTIIVSNAIEALSLLSVRDLSKTLRVIVTGQAKPENVVRQALASPVPIILVEYQRGARCGRHRRLRELLLKDLDQINQLCPSDLRLGTPGFETIALQTEKVPKLANALCDLIGVRPIPPPEVVDPPDNPYVSF